MGGPPLPGTPPSTKRTRSVNGLSGGGGGGDKENKKKIPLPKNAQQQQQQQQQQAKGIVLRRANSSVLPRGSNGLYL